MSRPSFRPTLAALCAAALATACGGGDGGERRASANADYLGTWALTRDALDSDAELLGIVASSFDIEIDSANVHWTFEDDGTFYAWGPARATTTRATAGLTTLPRTRVTTYERAGTYEVTDGELRLLEHVVGPDGVARKVPSTFRVAASRPGEYLVLTAEHLGDDVFAPLSATGLGTDDLFLMTVDHATSQTIVLERPREARS